MQVLPMRPLPLLVATLLAGCQAYPALAPAAVTLELHPRVQPGSRHLQEVVTAYDAASIQHLDLALYGVADDGATAPTLDANGQAVVVTVTRDDVAQTTVADAHASVGGLAGNHRYRILATAYADDGTVISTADSGSQTDVTVPADLQAATVPATVQVQLLDHVFEGQASSPFGPHIVGGDLHSVPGSAGL
jgi:hypothetical protein